MPITSHYELNEPHSASPPDAPSSLEEGAGQPEQTQKPRVFESRAKLEMHGRLMERSISYIDTWYDNNPGQTMDPAELTRMVQGFIDADVGMFGDVQEENPLDAIAQTPESDMAFEAQADEGNMGEDIIVGGNGDEDSDHDEKGGANEYAYKGKSIEEVVNDIFNREGKPIEELVSNIFDPGVARANIVPMPMGAYREHEGPVQWDNWVTPEAFKALVEMAPKAAKEFLKAWMLPGHVTQGGAYTVEDTTNAALSISSGGVVTRAPRGSLGMGLRYTGKEGPFGSVFEADNWRDAVRFLKNSKSGEVANILDHPEVGKIGIAWGKAGTGKSDGHGLAKLVIHHPEVVDNLPEILRRMNVDRTKVITNRVHLRGADHSGAVKLEWDGQAGLWLLTLFKRELK